MFDPGAFDAFLAEQPDLGTKWSPRFVRIVAAMPLTANNKVNKQPLRAGRLAHHRAGLVAARPRRRLPPLHRRRRSALVAEFAEHGRTEHLPR